MKRREFFKAAGLGIAASAVAAPAIAQSMPEIKWRMTCSWPKSLDTLYGAAEIMAKTSPKRPTTNFRSRFLPPAKSCPACKRSMRRRAGTVEIGHTASYYYFGKDPTFAFGTSVAVRSQPAP